MTAPEGYKEVLVFQGTLESIYIAAAPKELPHAITHVQAIPGVGLEGDRYARRQGTFFKPEPDFELTLIEAEALEAMQRDYDFAITPEESRRNLLTRNVPLNHLVGRDFQIGDVKIRGVRLCEPCSHLQSLTGQPVIKGLRHRGGLRAQILSSGLIRVGDKVS